MPTEGQPEAASPETTLPQALKTGPRVLIRYPQPVDQAEFTTINRGSKRHYVGWVAPPTTPEQFAAYLERCRREDFEGLLVCRRSDGAVMGAVNLSQIFYGNFRSCYMGYQIGSRFAGQGYMTEALPLVLWHAFASLKLHRVEANIQPGNTASIALVERTGFRLEGYSPRYLKIGGRWRDHERWAILQEDWQELRRAGQRSRARATPDPTAGT